MNLERLNLEKDKVYKFEHMDGSVHKIKLESCRFDENGEVVIHGQVQTKVGAVPTMIAYEDLLLEVE